MATSYKRLQAVSTTISILRYLSEQREPVSGQDIAKTLKIPHGTVMTHLATLDDAGFIRFSCDGNCELGTGLALLFYRYRSNLEGKIDKLNKELESIGGKQ